MPHTAACSSGLKLPNGQLPAPDWSSPGRFVMATARRQDPPIQSLTVFLIKAGTKTYLDALEEDAASRLTSYSLKQGLAFEGELFLAPQRTVEPRWLHFLADGTTTDLEQLSNASTSAVLFIRSSRRLLAFTFGYGRSLLRPAQIERSFGLRVVLNTVDKAALRSVDTKTVQELTVHTRRQTSRASSFPEFEVDKEEDLLGAVVGVPQDAGFARLVAGADALQFRAALAFQDLGTRCQSILQAYRSDEYKRRGFEFVDYVQRVADPTVIDALDGDLLDDLQKRNFSQIHMAPPEIIDWNAIEGYSFTKQAVAEPEIRLDAFFGQIRKSSEITIDRLKRQRVFVHYSNAVEPVAKWPTYRTLVAEQQRNTRRYVLSGGDWYVIASGFAEGIRNRVKKIPPADLHLPAARAGEKEADYNRRAVRRGVYCVDRKCPRIAGDPVEVCDLYVSSSRQFVHVKWWKSSSTLSHLFAQGRASAEAFLSDSTYRKGVQTVLKEQARTLASHIPNDRPDPTQYRVVFAIIKGGRGWKQSLPFFSQLQLVRAAESLRGQGLDVRLEAITVEN